MSLFTRRRRVEQLAALGDVTGLRETLVDASRDGGGSTIVLCAAAGALVDLGENGITALVEAVLTDPDHIHFGRIEDETFHRAAGPHAVALLSRALLHDPDPRVRLAAAGMLRRLDTPLADEAFAAAVSDSDAHVRLSAARGLADHGDARGSRALLEWVAHSDNPLPALVGLTRIGGTQLVPVLEQLHATSRNAQIAEAIEQTIKELENSRTAQPGVAARLEHARDQLRSIAVVDVLPGAARFEADRVRHRIAVICADIDAAITALRTGATPSGEPMNRSQVGLVLAAVVACANGKDFDRLLAAGLEPRGIRAFHTQLVELDVVATDLQERPVSPGRIGA